MNYRRNHVASNAVVKREEQQQMEKINMYRKLVPLICAMLLSTAAFGQGGGGGAGGAGGAAGGGAAGSANQQVTITSITSVELMESLSGELR